MSGGPIPWVRRVRVTNYRSIAACDVALGPLTLLVGPNGSGKSNFMDALSLVADAVATTPEQAVDVRGGFGEILRRSPEPSSSFSVTLDVTVPWGTEPEQWARGSYGFEFVRSRRRGARPVEVVWEECVLRWRDKTERFRVDRGAVEDEAAFGGVRSGLIEPDRLYLPTAGARPNLAPLFGRLRGMRFYNLDTSTLRQPQPESEGAALGRRGEHLADVLGGLSMNHPDVKDRYDAYLGAAVPGIEGIDRQFAGTYVAVAMRQRTGNGETEVTFGPGGTSDGTIRAAGILAALFQPPVLDGLVSLVGIEEPELALHPSAAGVLFDALTEASERVQVVASSQSADLLDRDDVDPAAVRAVAAIDGSTIIGDVDDVSRTILREKRFTLGELMRGNQLTPRQAG
jgi:predicted ATPase